MWYFEIFDIFLLTCTTTQAAFKNWVPFENSITKTDGTTTDDAGSLDLAMPCISWSDTVQLIIIRIVFGFTEKVKPLNLILLLHTKMLLNILNIK